MTYTHVGAVNVELDMTYTIRGELGANRHPDKLSKRLKKDGVQMLLGICPRTTMDRHFM